MRCDDKDLIGYFCGLTGRTILPVKPVRDKTHVLLILEPREFGRGWTTAILQTLSAKCWDPGTPHRIGTSSRDYAKRTPGRTSIPISWQSPSAVLGHKLLSCLHVQIPRYDGQSPSTAKSYWS